MAGSGGKILLSNARGQSTIKGRKRRHAMTLELLKSFFMWCSIINFGLMMLSFIIITTAKEWAYKMHSRWFNISKPAFDLILYCFLGIYKLLLIVFCIIPWIALSIVG
jgi:hypothetical protein